MFPHRHHGGGYAEASALAREQAEAHAARRDMRHGNVIGAMIHESRAEAAHRDAVHAHHGHYGHRHRYAGGGGLPLGMAVATAAGYAAGAAVSSVANGVASAIAPRAYYGPPPQTTTVVYTGAPAAYPVAYAPAPVYGAPPVYAAPPAPAPAVGAPPPGMRYVQAVPPAWSLSPAFPGQAPGASTQDGTGRPLFAVLQLVPA